MRLTYDITIDDLLRFHDHHFANSPGVKRQLFLTRIAVAAMPVALGLYFFTNQNSPSALVVGVLLAVVAYVYIGKIILSSSRDQVRKMYKEAEEKGENEGLVGEHTLELTDTGLVDRTQTGEAKLPWSRINRIETTGNDVYLFLNSKQAQIVPRGTVKKGDWNEFSKAVQNSYASYKQAQT